ncbi:MAG: FAD-dependent oxidoreductase, partial [Acetobacteraceae bacterium]|nr:FAD-dependent oxidoreductase [Acetobacteraceae bacterium]
VGARQPADGRQPRLASGGGPPGAVCRAGRADGLFRHRRRPGEPVYPFAGKVLVGSTDLAQDDPDAARCSDAEADYLRQAVAEVFPDPTLAIRPEQVVQRFCGVRPLPRAEGTDIGQVTRDHSIARLQAGTDGPPVLCLIGGKWTTFRAFSEQAADEVLQLLGCPRRTTTAEMPIGGSRGFPPDAPGRARLATELATASGLSPERVATLLGRYGTALREWISELAGGETPLPGCPDYSLQEIGHICRRERVETVEDVLRRRTLIALTGRDTPEVIAAVTSLLEKRGT